MILMAPVYCIIASDGHFELSKVVYGNQLPQLQLIICDHMLIVHVSIIHGILW